MPIHKDWCKCSYSLGKETRVEKKKKEGNATKPQLLNMITES